MHGEQIIQTYILMKVRILTFCAIVLLLTTALRAGEGMWLPLLLSQLNEAEMKSMGMKMSAEDIYSVNKGSLKDAIVHFGGFCTGEVISSQGLVLTNHHCGYGQIQYHSSLSNNYLQDGFWAATKADELPNPGLFVTFIVRIEDVTATVLANTNDEMSERERQSTIDKNLGFIRQGYRKEAWEEIVIRPFFNGNQYFLFVTETYKDVRLVGAPPSSIGKFGADTDNWVWPRHTGDFALFRIYASPDNKPAEYSPNNVPFKPRKHLPVSLDGVTPNDFTMVFGFPGRTDQYLPAAAIDQRVNVLNPIRIGIRDRSLAVMDAAMRRDPQVKIQYASKQARIANAWKKWIGETQGVRQTNGIQKRREMEEEFRRRVAANPKWNAAFGGLLPEMERLYREIEPLAVSRDYVMEIALRNVELFQLMNSLHTYNRMLKSSGEEALKGRSKQVITILEEFYKDFNLDVDQEIAVALLDIYFNKVQLSHLAPFAVEQINQEGKNYTALARALYLKSLFTQKEKVMALANENLPELIRQLNNDYAYLFVRSIIEHHEAIVMTEYQPLEDKLNALQRKYMMALMAVFPERRFYPDANSTMRVTYGQVAGYKTPEKTYDFMTDLDGMVAKYVPGDYEFDLPPRLLELHKAKDYGRYALPDGRMPVCFIGSNHTTGGNSGSPAIDAHGNLIGLNFDRTWEGTMSDVYYDASICRNIMVDLRYILFIIDKFAGATHLVDEMTLVYPKTGK
jgi:hypothetical protein